MVFDREYREEVALSDGTSIVLRLIRPEDKALFRRGLEQLSPRSRWRRFFAPHGDFTDAELAYLTEVDGLDHFAIGALRDSDGVAVARFVRIGSAESGGVAEPAMVVIDELQGHGLGKLLLTRLVDAARERGITRFRADVLAENEPMLALLRQHVGDAISAPDDAGVISLDIPLDEQPRAGQHSVLHRLLALAAQGVLCIRLRR